MTPMYIHAYIYTHNGRAGLGGEGAEGGKVTWRGLVMVAMAVMGVMALRQTQRLGARGKATVALPIKMQEKGIIILEVPLSLGAKFHCYILLVIIIFFSFFKGGRVRSGCIKEVNGSSRKGECYFPNKNASKGIVFIRLSTFFSVKFQWISF